MEVHGVHTHQMKTDGRNARKVENIATIKIKFIANPNAHRWVKDKKRHGFIGYIDPETIK